MAIEGSTLDDPLTESQDKLTRSQTWSHRQALKTYWQRNYRILQNKDPSLDNLLTDTEKNRNTSTQCREPGCITRTVSKSSAAGT